jgi:hypothetical protein
MTKPLITLITVAFAVAAASPLRHSTGTVVAPVNPAATAQGGSPHDTQGARTAAPGPWDAVRHYFPACDEKKQAGRPWCIEKGTSAAVLIAVVPDPIRTHMALVFDRTIESIQLAAERSGYVADRFWFPWTSSGKPADPDAQKPEQGQPSTEPGLLLFRRGATGPGPQLLFVLLSTDTPAAGLDMGQMQEALRHRSEICQQASCGGEPLYLLGPTFSGSLDSLRRVIESEPNLKFEIASGSVSGACAMFRARLGDSSDLTSCQEIPKDYSRLPNVSGFQTFVHGTESTLRRFVEYLEDIKAVNCHDAPRIALMTEAATTYGAAGAAGKDAKAATGSANYENCQITSYRYPREIAALRNAYINTVAGTKTAADASQPKQFLTLNLADHSTGTDDPPDLSLEQSPLSKEAVLMNWAAALRRERYRYIGILGTNNLDVLFLSEFLGRACPDARVFVDGSDLMFVRDPDNAPYLGNLALTTYPLFARNLDWTKAIARDRLPFADQYEEGQFNAFLWLMSKVQKSVNLDAFSELSEPFSTPALPPPAPRLTARPWLTVVGTGGYWPVALLGPTNQPSRIETLESQDLTGAWRVTRLAIAAVAIIHALVVLYAGRFRDAGDFAIIGSAAGQRALFVQAGTAILAIALMFTEIPDWQFGAMGWFRIPGLIALAALTLAAAYTVRLSAAANVRHIWLHAGLLVVATGTVVTWWSLFREGTGHYGFFAAFRATHLASGVSPLMPMFPLLILGYSWTISELRRLRFDETTRPRLVTCLDSHGHTRPGIASEQRIVRAIEGYLPSKPYALFQTIVFALWLVLLDPIDPFHLFEHAAFGRLFEVAFCTAVALMLVTAFRLLEIWSELRRLLSELERSGLRYGFSRLENLSWSFWRQGGDDTRWAMMSRSLASLHQIASDPWGVTPDISEPDIETVKKLHDQAAQLSIALANGTGHAHDVEPLTRALPHLLAQSRAESSNSLWVAAIDDVDDAAQKLAAVPAGRAGAAALPELMTSVQHGLAHLQAVATLLHTSVKVLVARRKLTEARLEALKPGARAAAPAEIARLLGGFQRAACVASNDAWNLLKLYWAKQNQQWQSSKEQETSEVAKDDFDLRRLHRLEEYVALRYLEFVCGVMAIVRRLMVFLAVSFSLVLIALHVYSFEPHQSLIWSFTALFVLVGTMVVTVFAQIHRDPTLSRVTGTTANSLDFHFYVRILTFGAGPFLTLLATQFPAIGRYLLSLIQPGLEALK